MPKREQPNQYMKLLSLETPEDVHREVKKLASAMSDDQHVIRSCIFDLHAAVEVELRRIFYHHFKQLLFLTSDESRNELAIAEFDRAVGKLGFMDMYRVLEPIFKYWPYPELQSIREINNARNLAAHSNAIDKVFYQGRNPFTDPDCFAQMYFDVWAIKQGTAKIFEWAIKLPRWKLRTYVQKYGEL